MEGANTYTKQHEGSTADLFDDKNGNERGHEVLCAVAGGEELRYTAASKTDFSVK
jgi:hypothetical protein